MRLDSAYKRTNILAGFFRFNRQGFRRVASAPAVARYLQRQFPGESLNWRATPWIAVYPGIGIALNRLQKNANSSAVVLLQDLETGVVEHQREAKNRIRTLFDFGLGHRRIPKDLAHVVIVRNPYSRVLSAFLNKSSSTKIRRRHGTFEATREGFGNFLRFLEEGGLSADSHWDLQTRHMLLPPEAYDGIVRFENLREEMLAFLARQGLEPRPGSLEEIYPSARGKATDATAKLDAFYTPESRDRVARLFAPDFEALGYDTAYPGELAE